jgi:zinc protease
MPRTLLLAFALLVGCSATGVTDPAPASSTPSPPTTDPGPGPSAGPSAGPSSLVLPGLLDDSDAPFPTDEAVTVGQLDNGLRYYVRANDHPGAKAELRLVIGSGSVDESGPDTGVAHFLEHMLFNGTEDFPENELVATLRSFGASFGADVNASTGYEATVYELSVPDTSVELGLTVLEQWLSHATIDPVDVEAERGVVLDEWRTRTQSTFGRLFATVEPMFLDGSPYLGRSPIGGDESIRSMTAETLRAYYDRHYRPDNAAVVVVGDIDVDAVVTEIERRFAPVTARGEAGAPVEFSFPVDLEPDAAVHLDPDQRTVDVEITFPLPATPVTSTLGLRVAVLDALALDIVMRRLDDDVVAGTAPFDDVTGGSNSFVTGLDAPGVYAFTDAGRAVATAQAILDEFERVRRFGFDEFELGIARESLAAVFRSRFDGRDSTQDRDYADSYVDDALDGTGYPSIADEYELVTEILDAVDVEALDLRFRTRLANTAPHLVVTAPTGSADTVPTVGELLELVEGVADRALDPRPLEGELPESLMARPEPVEPLTVTRVVDDGNELFDPVRIEFPNGVTVILNTNGIVDGQVFLEGASRGGTSLVADDDVVDALYAAEIVTSSGVASYDAALLDRILAGADVGVDAWLEPYSEHVGGSAATADLEVMFQLIHLLMTQPRVDEVALRRVVNRYGPVIDDPASDASLSAVDALLDLRYPGELRYAVLPTPEEFATLDQDGVRRVWGERFGTVDGWVFVLSGDFDVEEVTGLAASYLGTLSAGAPETPIDVEDPPPSSGIRVEIQAGTGETGSVSSLSTVAIGSVSGSSRVLADLVTQLLAARLIDVVREEFGDSYSPSAGTSLYLDPDPVVETYVFATGAPDRVAVLADLVSGEIADLVAGGATEREYSDAFAQVSERYRFVDNGEFVSELLLDELEPAWDLDTYLTRVETLASLDADDVLAFLRSALAPERAIEVLVTPR